MTRITLAFAALLCSLPTAMATLSPRSDFPALGPYSLAASFQNRISDFDKPMSAVPKQDTARQQSFVITDGTEVQLDGLSCKLQEVPNTATVVSIDLAQDGKTVLKLSFKSKPMGGAER